MRLNYKTRPIWSIIDNNTPELLKADPMFESQFSDIHANWRGCIGDILNLVKDPQFKDTTGIYYLSKPFENAIHTAIPKIIDSTDEWKDVETGAGVIINSTGITFYLANPNVESGIDLMFFGAGPERIVTYGILHGEKGFHGYYPEFTDNGITNNRETALTLLHYLKLVLYFIKNCEIETKELKPNEKHRTATEKHYNETKSNITLLDCTWFTTLISNIKHHVKGHLRWQPYGEGRALRKLIWINEFERGGFVRQAKKLA